jgi:hypothetical protein
MSGAVPSLRLYAFMVRLGTTFRVEMKTNSMTDDVKGECGDTYLEISYSWLSRDTWPRILTKSPFIYLPFFSIYFQKSSYKSVEQTALKEY